MPKTFVLKSSAFDDGEPIPQTYTCDGEDRVPPLEWSDPPEGTRSFALILEDPDAPRGTFTHWLLYNIPAGARQLTEPVGETLHNDFGRSGYGGPCPPAGHGPHRYIFTLYATDEERLGVHGTTRKALERALRQHTLGTARLMGRYEREGTS